jgi:hypothetical protein
MCCYAADDMEEREGRSERRGCAAVPLLTEHGEAWGTGLFSLVENSTYSIYPMYRYYTLLVQNTKRVPYMEV